MMRAPRDSTHPILFNSILLFFRRRPYCNSLALSTFLMKLFVFAAFVYCLVLSVLLREANRQMSFYFCRQIDGSSGKRGSN